MVAPFVVGLLINVGAAALSYADRRWLRPPYKEKFKWPRFEDIRIQTSREGIAIEKVYGTYKKSGNVIWAQTKEPDGRPLLFLAGTSNEQQAISLAIGLGEGPFDALVRIWADDTVILDRRLGHPPINRMNEVCESWEWYDGGETQGEDPVIKAYMSWESPHGPDENPAWYTPVVPAHRGMSYIRLHKFGLIGFGGGDDDDSTPPQWQGNLPNLTFELAKDVTSEVPWDRMFVMDSSAAAIPLVAFQGPATGMIESRFNAVEAEVVPFTGFGGSYAYKVTAPSGISAAPITIDNPNSVDEDDLGFYDFAQEHFYLSFAFEIEAVPATSSSIATLWGGPGEDWLNMVLSIVSGGALRLTTIISDPYAAVVFDESDAGVIVANTPYTIEMYRQSGTSGESGAYGVRVNGVEVMSGTRVHVYSGGIGQVWLGKINGGFGGAAAYVARYGNIAVSYTAWIGNVKVFAKTVNADGTYSQWGGAYSDVDELPQDELASTIDADSDHLLSTFAAIAPDALDAGTAIAALQVFFFIDGETEDNGRSPYIYLRRGVTDILGNKTSNAHNGGEFVSIFQQLWAADPFTDGQITLDTWNGLEIGVKAGAFDPESEGEETVLITQIGTTYAVLEVESDVEDWLVFYPDDFRLLIEKNGTFVIWNLSTMTEELRVSYTDQPVLGCGFDIDEQGLVYTTVWTGSGDPDQGRIIILDGESLTTAGEDLFPIDRPTIIRVSRDSRFPWIHVMAQGGEVIWLFHRETLAWGGGDAGEVQPPDGFNFISFDVRSYPFGPVLVAVSSDGGSGARLQWWELIEGAADDPTTVDISAEIENPACVLYYPGLDVVMVGQKTPVEKVAFYRVRPTGFAGPIDFTLVGQLEGEVVPDHPWSAWRRGVFNLGLFYAWGSGSTIHRIDLSEMIVTDTWEADEQSDPPPPVTPNWRGGNVYDVSGHSIITGCDLTDSSYVRVYLDLVEPQTVSLSTIIRDICEDVGIPSGEISTPGLAIGVRGFAVTDRMPAAAALEPLMGAFFFDIVDSSGELRFLERGGPPVVTIPAGHLAAHRRGDARPPDMASTRQDDVELPQTVEITYIAYDHDYEQGHKHDDRQVTHSEERVLIDFPICLTGTQAMEIVTKRLLYAWGQRLRHRFQIPRDYLWLDPADVVLIEEADATHRVRIDEQNYENRLLKIEATNEIASHYTAPGMDDDPLIASRGSLPSGPSSMALIDVGQIYPTLENRPGMYVAVAASLESWQGAIVSVSRDGGASWSNPVNVANRAMVGKAGSMLAEVDNPFLWDEAGSIDVYPSGIGFAPETLTEAEVLAGGNRAMVGSELIAYQTATENADGTWTLSRLLRGRRGTDWAVASHAIGERVVLLNNAVAFLPLQLSDFGQSLTFRVTSVGGGPQFVPVTKTVAFQHLLPLSPVHIKGSRDGSENIYIQWTRRSRSRTSGTSNTSVPLSEATEGYSIEILDGSDVVRTIETTLPEFEYAAADQIVDGFTPPELIEIRIYQRSAVVGRGIFAYGIV